VRGVAEWLSRKLASRHEENQLSEGAVFAVPLKIDVAVPASHGPLTGAHLTERLIDDDSAPKHVLEHEPPAASLCAGSATESASGTPRRLPEPDLPRPLFAEDGTSIVDPKRNTVLQILPFPGQKTGPYINGDAVARINELARAKALDSPICDITPYTRPLLQARLQVQELALANRRKDEFLAILSHELRSPLATIKNAVCLLNSPTHESAVRQKAQALIERQVGRMTQLVDDLLDVSRITQGRLQLQRERMDLRVVVSNAIETLESDINARHQTLVAALPDAPVWVRADPWRLEQVFVNLLANASKFTEAGAVLTVWVHTRDGQAVVRIQDPGMGITPEALPHIFDLFRQADGAASRSKSGLGIGLALVRTLVELHGGSVSAASAGPMQGSEFTVRLPRESP